MPSSDSAPSGKGDSPAKMKLMELNEAFEALDAMHKANLEVEFSNIPHVKVDKSMLDQFCTQCLREALIIPRRKGPFTSVRNAVRRKCRCCMVCHTPVCAKHAVKGHELHLCEKQCKPLLSADDLRAQLNSMEEGEERSRFIYNMMESYDRARLLLQYACQYEDLDQLANALEGKTRTYTRIRLGGSGMGFMAGVTGVGAMAAPACTAAHIAAGAAIVAAGPHLLAASLVLGCTGAFTTLGHEMAIHKFYKCSDINVRYSRIVAWQSLIKTVARVAAELKIKLAADIKDEVVCSYEPQTNALEEASRPENPKVYPTTGSNFTDRTECMTEWNDESSSLCSSGGRGNGEEEEKTECPEAFEDEIAEDAPLMKTESKASEPHDFMYFPEKLDARMVKKIDQGDQPNKTEFEDLLDDKDRELDESKEEERRVVTTSTALQKKHPLAFLVPLFPMADDAVLTACKVLADPNAGARVALHHAFRVAQVASVACGALSAFTIVYEGRNINKSLEVLERPCDKAERIRNLRYDVAELPETDIVADFFQEYEQAQAATA